MTPTYIEMHWRIFPGEKGIKSKILPAFASQTDICTQQVNNKQTNKYEGKCNKLLIINRIPLLMRYLLRSKLMIDIKKSSVIRNSLVHWQSLKSDATDNSG